MMFVSDELGYVTFYKNVSDDSWLECENLVWHCTKKWSFPLRISSVNVTKSTVSCGFGHIYW